MAASRRGVNMTESFADQTTFTLTPRQWKAFNKALDRPPMARPKPRLQELLSEKTVLEH